MGIQGSRRKTGIAQGTSGLRKRAAIGKELQIMNLTLFVWRQKNPGEKGNMSRYEAKDITPHMSFLEMLDVVNEDLIKNGMEQIAFDHDCREGICGTCWVIGIAHGPEGHHGLPTAHAAFRDGDVIT
jgi:succinate dehydrogenase / fumarate reductase iron-sulfur subunit